MWTKIKITRPKCPSSGFLRQRAGLNNRGLWLIDVVISGGPQLVLQAAIGNGLPFESFPVLPGWPGPVRSRHPPG
jgi:hypothetical protein